MGHPLACQRIWRGRIPNLKKTCGELCKSINFGDGEDHIYDETYMKNSTQCVPSAIACRCKSAATPVPLYPSAYFGPSKELHPVLWTDVQFARSSITLQRRHHDSNNEGGPTPAKLAGNLKMVQKYRVRSY